MSKLSSKQHLEKSLIPKVTEISSKCESEEGVNSDVMLLLKILSIQLAGTVWGCWCVKQHQTLRQRGEAGTEPAATYQDLVRARKCL